MKYCTNCGSPLADIAMFCNKCGAFQREDKSKETEKVKSEPEDLCESAEKSAQTEYESKYTGAVKTRFAESSVRRLLVKLISLVLSVVFCLILFSAALLGVVRGTFDPKMIARNLASVEMNDIKNIIVEDTRGREVPVSKMILDSCGTEIKEKYDLNEDKIMRVLEDVGAGEFFGEIVGDYAAYMVGADELRELDGARVVTWLRENEDTLEETLKYDIKEEDYAELEEQLDKSEIVKSLSATQIRREFDIEELAMMRMVMSLGVYAAVIICVLLIAALIIVINSRKLHALFAYVTPSFAAVGGMFIVLYTVLKLAASPDILPDVAGVELVSIIISPFIMPVLIRGIVMLGVGIIPAVVYKIVCKRKGIKA